MKTLLNKHEIEQTLQTWAETMQVYAPQHKEAYAQFLPYDGTGKLALDEQRNTRYPPKALFLPQSEALLKYTRIRGYEAVREELKPRVVFGIRPCDAQAVALLDTVFEQDQYSDPQWKNRRGNTILVGLGCDKPGSTCFCTTVGSGPFSQRGLDAILTDLGNAYLVETLTANGETLFDRLPAASEEQERDAVAIQAKASETLPIAFATAGLKEKLDHNFDSPYWDEVSQSCLGCGVCTFLCPTCFCFDIADETQRGERVRNWDTCMFRTYSLEASGHNPRPSHRERTRQRISHKFTYWLDQVNEIGCTGCGRCVRYCPVGLDIRAMLRKAGLLESEAAHVI